MAAALFCCASLASAQSVPQVVPVSTTVSGNTATVVVGPASAPLADLTLTFDDASGLTASSLGVSAQIVNLSDSGLLARLPGVLTQPDALFPLLVTIEPPSTGGLAFDRTVRVEMHTHALTYSAGSSYRLFKASLGAGFKDITDEVAPGSVRARGTTGGFSQFLILADLRESSDVVAGKIAALRARVATLPSAERPAFDALINATETAVANESWSDAIAAIDSLRARAAARAGNQLTDTWLATRNGDNQAGDLIAGAATLRFSVSYLRDYGD
nr:DUF6689 family protein [Lysobacter dokdonensis]